MITKIELEAAAKALFELCPYEEAGEYVDGAMPRRKREPLDKKRVK